MAEPRTPDPVLLVVAAFSRHPGALDWAHARLEQDFGPVQLVSPANKVTPGGRAAYLETRRQGVAAKAGTVEIDLVLQGQPTLEYSRDGLPDWDYAVTVTRSTQPERYEIYTATLQKRLPRFRLPLASDDRDTVLDLHTAFTRCYDQGNFAAKIDYARDPATTLSAEDCSWLREVLKQQKLRQ